MSTAYFVTLGYCVDAAEGKAAPNEPEGNADRAQGLGHRLPKASGADLAFTPDLVFAGNPFSRERLKAATCIRVLGKVHVW